MRNFLWTLAFLLAIAAGAWVAWRSGRYLNEILKLDPNSRSFRIGQGVITLGVAYFVYPPTWWILKFFVPTSSRLMACPDCEHLISKLANRCPQCGRPISPKNAE